MCSRKDYNFLYFLFPSCKKKVIIAYISFQEMRSCFTITENNEVHWSVFVCVCMCVNKDEHDDDVISLAWREDALRLRYRNFRSRDCLLAAYERVH